jgi:xylulokinase
VIDATHCSLIIGTTSVMATHVASKRLDAEHGITTVPSPVPGMYIVIAENGIGGKALDFFVTNVVYAGSARPDDAFEQVLAEAAGSPAGSNGVLFLPWLIGSLAPAFDRAIRGAFLNLSLGTTRSDMARAVLEGVALNATWLLPHVAALADASYAELALGGGGAASALWGQALADCCGLPVRRLANSRTTNAHGAALLALAEAGAIAFADIPSLITTEQLHEPDAVAHDHFRDVLATFVDLHTRLGPPSRNLNAPKENSS